MKLYQSRLEKEEIEMKFKEASNRNRELIKSNEEVYAEIEELDVKNHKLLSNNTDLDDKIEELYREISHLEQNVDNDKLVKVSNENKTLKDKLKKLEESRNECIDNVHILEHTLQNRLSEIQRLNQKIEDLENQKVEPECNNCQNATNKNSEKHSISEHADEDMPSTSKCGKCDYESDEESDIKTHIESAHKFRCDLCDFQADLKDDLETHELFEHNNPCPECINTFRTPDKLEQHICKLEVTNPENGPLYTKNWVDGNGCNSIYCNLRKMCFKTKDLLLGTLYFVQA